MTARDRELWDAIVYDAYDYPIPNPMSENGMTSLPLKDRRTLVIAENTVPTIQICIQSSDESYTGERLAAYSDSSWWRRPDRSLDELLVARRHSDRRLRG